MTDFEQQVTEIKVHGFAVIPDVFDFQQVDKMRQVLIHGDSNRGELTYNRGLARKSPNLVTLDPVFFTCIDRPQILPLMEYFLEQSLILDSLVFRIVRPGDPIQWCHIHPDAAVLIIVQAAVSSSYAILDEASLSFLGLGVDAFTSTRGLILADGSSFIFRIWWLGIFPGLAIMLTGLLINFIGDTLQNFLDLRQSTAVD